MCNNGALDCDQATLLAKDNSQKKFSQRAQGCFYPCSNTAMKTEQAVLMHNMLAA